MVNNFSSKKGQTRVFLVLFAKANDKFKSFFEMVQYRIKWLG